VLAVAAHPVDGCHAQQASPGRIGRQLHYLELISLCSRQPVVIRQQTVHHDVVGLQKFPQTAVLPQEVSEGFVDLNPRGFLGAEVEVGIKGVVEAKKSSRSMRSH